MIKLSLLKMFNCTFLIKKGLTIYMYSDTFYLHKQMFYQASIGVQTSLKKKTSILKSMK